MDSRKSCILFLFIFLFIGTTHANDDGFSLEIDGSSTMTLKDGSRSVWQYNAEFKEHPNVPEKDPRRMAGTYVHPLYGIDGEILTDNAPKDHYHHHGVFWTWPHVSIQRPDGKVEQYDVWTSNTKMKQLHVRMKHVDIVKDKAAVTLENGWFIAPEMNKFEWDESGNPVSEKVVEEIVTITTYPIKTDGELRSRAVDFDFEWTIGKNAVTLQGAEGKSYGGMTVRFRPSTDKPGGDSAITVPDGVAAEDLPEKPLPWADYTSCFERNADDKPTGRRTGAAVFIQKDHPDYPPTWLTRYYGAICVGWPGVKERTFQPGEKIHLSYRIWIHDRPVNVETLQKYYSEYCGDKNEQ